MNDLEAQRLASSVARRRCDSRILVVEDALAGNGVLGGCSGLGFGYAQPAKGLLEVVVTKAAVKLCSSAWTMDTQRDVSGARRGASVWRA